MSQSTFKKYEEIVLASGRLKSLGDGQYEQGDVVVYQGKTYTVQSEVVNGKLKISRAAEHTPDKRDKNDGKTLVVKVSEIKPSGKD